MAWEVEFSPEFEHWWDSLSENEQVEINRKVILLQEHGPSLPRPHSDVIVISRFPNMKELRANHGRKLLRVLYAFDPSRTAILLLGGDKTGNPQWYDRSVPIADDLFEHHMRKLSKSKERS